MSRGLCVLAALAILAGGCASRRAVDRLGSDVGRLRSELAEMRVAQEANSRELANIQSQFLSMDVKPLREEVERLARRTDAVHSAVAATQTKVEALAAQPGAVATPSGRPAASPVPAPLPPNPAVMSPVPAPTSLVPTVMSPVPAATPPATSLSPPAAPPSPPAAEMLPSPTVSQPSPPAVVERPRVAPAPAPSPMTAPAQSIARTPTPTPPPTVTPARPAPKAGGHPEQEYAAALATFRSREHGQAVIDFIDFLAMYPKHPLAGNAQYWIGEAYWAQRDYRQALVEFERVFQHGPAKGPDALLKIGLCYLRLGDVSRAQQTWQRVVNEYPKSEPAAMARSLIATHSSARR